MSTDFVITTDRLIYRHGVLAKHGIEIPLERVNTVFFHQAIFERMVGAGDLVIESAGERGRQEFSNVRRPSAVQNEIYKQMEANENRKFDRMKADPVVHRESIPDQIGSSTSSAARGLTQVEFDAKKQELLGRMYGGTLSRRALRLAPGPADGLDPPGAGEVVTANASRAPLGRGRRCSPRTRRR